MALYIPLIGGTGGNVGTQSSALIVQGLANSSLDAQNTWKQIVKESVVAVINATICFQVFWASSELFASPCTIRCV